MNNILNILVVFSVSIVLISCSSKTEKSSDKYSNINIFQILSEDGNVSFLYFKKYISSFEEVVANIEASEVELKMLDSDKNIELIKIKPNKATHRISHDSAIVTEFSVFHSNSFDLAKKSMLKFEIVKQTIKPKEISELTDEDFLILPDIKKEGDGYKMEAYAIKLKNSSDDVYFPSSEQLRAELISAKGTLLWSSNHEMNYLTVIMRLLPINIGEIHKYQLHWDGKANDKRKVGEGKYTLLLGLPSSPKSYFTNSDLFLD